MFNTIVVGVDGHQGGRDALVLAERLGTLFGGDLIAVHAYHYDLFVSRGPAPDFESVMHEHALDLVERELQRTGVNAHAVARPDGFPARALHRAAKWHESDLIVVGSDQRGPIGRVLAGDVTLGALHGARCPVAVAPRRYAEHGRDQLQTIGVGYDGSPEARAAARLARDLAARAGARLRVISVVQAGEIASGDVVVGDPAKELCSAADELDLLVIGSRGHGPVRRVMLGSVSTKLVHQAPSPVLVLTRTAIDLDAAEPARAAATVRADRSDV